jgi:hypothetical protein
MTQRSPKVPVREDESPQTQRRSAVASPAIGTLPSAILSLQRQVGNRTATAVLQRWMEPKGDVVPRLDYIPVGGKQTPGLLWEENNKPPRYVYRYKDSTDQWWESDGKTNFKKIDPPAPEKPVATSATAKKRAKKKKVKESTIHWYDATEKSWKIGDNPTTYRQARPAERPELADFGEHGYEDAATVPVLVKMKYRPRPQSKPSKKNRSPELRALDRTARVMSGALEPEVSSPHLAAAIVNGELVVAGNTGDRNVRGAEKLKADELLDNSLDASQRMHGQGRSARDARKLRAIGSGDYQAHHTESADALDEIAGALTLQTKWQNVGIGGKGANHGELTVLGQMYEDMQKNPNTTGTTVVIPLGGLKLACQACWWSIGIFNDVLAEPLGYRVKVSGTHHGLFTGWKMPKYLADNPQAKAAFEGKLPKGWKLNGIRLDHTGPEEQPGNQEPDDSESEWEEVD